MQVADYTSSEYDHSFKKNKKNRFDVIVNSITHQKSNTDNLESIEIVAS